MKILTHYYEEFAKAAMNVYIKIITGEYGIVMYDFEPFEGKIISLARTIDDKIFVRIDAEGFSKYHWYPISIGRAEKYFIEFILSNEACFPFSYYHTDTDSIIAELNDKSITSNNPKNIICAYHDFGN